MMSQPDEPARYRLPYTPPAPESHGLYSGLVGFSGIDLPINPTGRLPFPPYVSGQQ